jgi:DNA-binding transcriptional LysR family regulator
MLDRLTLDQLRVLIAVAETGSFSAAARRLGRVQSAISQSVQSLEGTLGVALFDRAGKMPVLNPAGRTLLDNARLLVQDAETLRARAQSMAADLEPELSLAIEQLFPTAVLMAALKELSQVFPHLPVTLFTEGLSAAEQRLRDGLVRLAIYWPPGLESSDLEIEYLASIPLIPVASIDHPLAAETPPVAREVLQRYLQLVLTDRASLSAGVSGGIVSRQIWRFADLTSRLDFLLAGFGWCHMPLHLVHDHIVAGRLKRLELKESEGRLFPLYVVHRRGAPPGRAGRWLVENLRRRLSTGEGEPSFEGTRPRTVSRTRQGAVWPARPG